MSYPAPPGLADSSTARAHTSLPARPPLSSASSATAFKAATNGSSAKPAFTGFAPRSIAATNTFRTSSPAHYSAAPVTSYSSEPQYSQPQEGYTTQPQYAGPAYPDAVPQIRNPFVPTSSATGIGSGFAQPSNYDPEYEAQIQQWQSAYVGKDDGRSSLRPTGANTAPLGASSRNDTSSPAVGHRSSAADTAASATKTVQRAGGGTTWTDSSLLEWDPAHFRIFVGNLAGEVTDESLLKAFSKYPSVQKARVIRDKRTTKSKGYGFVSFGDGDDYFQAAREMQGKYIGSHPVLLKRATTEVKATTVQQKSKGKFGKGGKNGGAGTSGGKTEFGGVKKQPKTKGGLKVLG